MPWIRLYMTVEGHTEQRFAADLLTPHLAQFEIDVRPRLGITNRKLGRRGGVLDFANIQGDITRLMAGDQAADARFTTMLDLYALPHTFPGWVAAAKKPNPQSKVVALESALGATMKDPRFIPYIQLHEFEALLYCDLEQLARRINDSSAPLRQLRDSVARLTPEEINEGVATAPSKRIIQHVPAYESQKIRVGASTAVAIGLPDLRTKCPHFNKWIGTLEALNRP